MSYSVITDRQVEFIQQQIQLESYNRTRAYSYFKANKLIEPINPGAKQAIDHVLKKMKPGQISYGFQSLPDSVMRLDQVSGKIVVMGSIVVMNKQDLDAWKTNSSRVGGSKQGGPMGQAVAEQIQTLYDQVDKFLYWGDDISGGMDNDEPDSYETLISADWSVSKLLEFRLENKLVMVAVVDCFDDGLSAVYTFFDPEYSNRGLGVFGILSEIEYVQTLQLDWLYLGYWNPKTNKMSYKANYQPMEFFDGQEWQWLKKI